MATCDVDPSLFHFSNLLNTHLRPPPATTTQPPYPTPPPRIFCSNANEVREVLHVAHLHRQLREHERKKNRTLLVALPEQ